MRQSKAKHSRPIFRLEGALGEELSQISEREQRSCQSLIEEAVLDLIERYKSDALIARSSPVALAAAARGKEALTQLARLFGRIEARRLLAEQAEQQQSATQPGD